MSGGTINRRLFLRGSGLGLAGLFLSGATYRPGPAFAAGSRYPSATFTPDAEVSITAAPKQVQILPGAPTTVWGYEGQLLSGSGVTVTPVPGSYLGPILRAEKGKNIRIYFHNNLAEASVIHPHGLRVPEDCDGQPMQAIGPGQTKI